jgi:hypothetical protein
MKKLIIYLLCISSTVCVNGQTTSDCNLDTIFNATFREDWEKDSLGTLGLRKKYFNKIFVNERGLKKDLPILNLSKECIEMYLGTPNIYLDIKGKKTQSATYYLSISWIGSEKNDFEGIALEIEYCNGKIIFYHVFVT